MKPKFKYLFLLSFIIQIACTDTIIEEKNSIPMEYYDIFSPFMESVELINSDGSVFKLISNNAEIRCITNFAPAGNSSNTSYSNHYIEWEEYTQYIISDFFNLDLLLFPGSGPTPWKYDYDLIYRFHTGHFPTEFVISLNDAIGDAFLKDSLIKLNSGDTAWLWVKHSEGIIWYMNSELDVRNPQGL